MLASKLLSLRFVYFPLTFYCILGKDYIFTEEEEEAEADRWDVTLRIETSINAFEYYPIAKYSIPRRYYCVSETNWFDIRCSALSFQVCILMQSQS